MMKTKFLVLLSLLLWAMALPARAADSDQVDKAKKFIALESRAKAILFFMHPTVEYESLELRRQTTVEDSEKKGAERVVLPGIPFQLEIGAFWR